MGVALAHRIGRPFLEFTGLAYLAAVDVFRSLASAAERGRQAVELAMRHGWGDEPAAGLAYVILGAAATWRVRPEEAESWVLRAERVLGAETEPAAVLGMHYTRGNLELARGRDADALAALQAGERLGRRLTKPHSLLTPMRARLLHTLVRLGDVDRAEQVLAGLGEHDRDRAETRIATTVLRLAQDDPGAAAAAVAPVLDGSARVLQLSWLAHAFLLEAIARDALGDQGAAERALERALDLAEPDGALLSFLLHPVPGLLERHARNRAAHAALIAEILRVLDGPAAASPARAQPPLEPLSNSEMRVLRYLPTNLTMAENAGELHVSHNTIRTHMRHLYAKLGSHRRAEAVARARALGLLAPSALERYRA
jgi:LuxR family maltose regulon positive regulatory protein